jgi:hypothetical protein
MKIELSDDVFISIFYFLDINTISTLKLVSKKINLIANSEKIYQSLCKNEYNLSSLYKKEKDYISFYKSLYLKKYSYSGYGNF